LQAIGGLDLLDHRLQERDVEIGDADGAGAAFFLELHQCLEQRGQVHAVRRPVHQIEVDVIELQLAEAGVERPSDRIGGEIVDPDLGGDVQILPRDAGGRDRSSNGFFVAVHFSGVDMPIAQRERAFDCRAAGIALQAKGAEPEPWQADALGLQIFHDGS
jgi:hypothetical protein